MSLTPYRKEKSEIIVRYLLLLLSPVFFFSCDSLRNEVDPDRLNKQAEKLVVTGFISPQDTVLAVQVSRSAPVLGDDRSIRDVTNATVTISNGTRFIALKYAPNYNKQGVNVYWASNRDFFISQGQSYTLTVTTPNGQKVDAQCTIPNRPPNFEARLDSSVSERGTIYTNGSRVPLYVKEYTLRARWFDVPGQKNYYRIAGIFQSQNTPPANTTLVSPVGTQNVYFENIGLQTDSPSTDGTVLTSREGRYYQSQLSYTSTTVITGPGGNTVVNSNSSAEIVMSQVQLGRLLRFAELTVSLLHTDENYYRYHDAIARQDATIDNPFAEPVLIPTNINGGLGCFAGYNRSTVMIRLK